MIRGDLVSYSDICEALSVTEIILGFLATTGGDSHMTLTDYTKNVLQMSNQISLPVTKVSAGDQRLTFHLCKMKEKSQ